MAHRIARLLTCFFVLCASTVRADALDDEILREARVRGVEAEMRAGMAAADRADYAAAASRYGQAASKAPGFGHALRRQCSVEDVLGHGERAEALCRQAVQADPSPYNKSALAVVMVRSGKADKLAEANALVDEMRHSAPDHEALPIAALELAYHAKDLPAARAALAELRRTSSGPSLLPGQLGRFAIFVLDQSQDAGARDEAERLLHEAMELAPDDPKVLVSAVGVANAIKDDALFDKASRRLESAAPELAATHLFASIRHVANGEWSSARTSLSRAHELGLSDEQYHGVLAQIDDLEPWTARFWPLALRIAAGWFAALILLFVLGSILSLLTLRAAGALPREANGRSSGASLILRRAYGLVIALACAFYYVSLPLVLLAVIAGAGALIYGFFAVGHVPIKLVLFLMLGVIITVWAVLRSVFVRPRDADPGTRLDLAREPGLRALLHEVAGKVGTRPVDAVYLTPGTQVAVFERGGVVKQLTGRSERCMVLGLGVLDDMRLTDFKAVLAHEYGHFSNRDTAGGGLALAVRRSLIVMAQSLAEGGAATWYNPAWWFFRGFFAVFLRISQGASRLQEVLADRWAAFSYGSEAFVRGLSHIVERSARFDAQANVALAPVTESRTPLTNFYGNLRETVVAEEDVARAVQEAMDRKPSPYDSHPAPRDRIAWVRKLAAAEPPASDERLVWSIFAEREQHEREMTNEVNQALGLVHGPFIPTTPFDDFA
jgi:Zn-dependent protease with chaperone function